MNQRGIGNLWGIWLEETQLAGVPHRQVVLTVPKRLRPYCLCDRKLLGELCRVAARTVTAFFRVACPRRGTGESVAPLPYGNTDSRRMSIRNWCAIRNTKNDRLATQRPRLVFDRVNGSGLPGLRYRFRRSRVPECPFPIGSGHFGIRERFSGGTRFTRCDAVL